MDSSHFGIHPAKLNEGSFAHHEYEEQGSAVTDRQLEKESRTREGLHKLRHDILCGIGEFAGTFMFLLCAFLGAQSAIYNRSVGEAAPVAANDNEVSELFGCTILFISLSFGMSLLVVAWAFFRITGSAFNPAVTFSLWLVGGCDLRRACGVIVAQLLGGIAAAGVAKGFTLGDFAVGNRIAQGTSYRQAFGIEMFATALLVFTVLMLAAEKSRTTFLAPVGIGMALFIGHIASVGWTGAGNFRAAYPSLTGINPARTFGPDVVNGSFASYSWLYYLGQFCGALVATLLCRLTIAELLSLSSSNANLDFSLCRHPPQEPRLPTRGGRD
ncbi:aquaporin-like protein [Leucosporidium creatinivorum]|uniref:Aquaporin-like protein n=1 Tax=Leucosporidium creatinivorum TaxID=106004 RepID=A0A1Y2FEN3_9BASI|nr:aquaporin-like protein [Leucosporidium creatinivorum]